MGILEGQNPLQINEQTTRVVWVDPLDPNMDKGIQRGFREKYPDLTKIKKVFEILEQITKTGGQEVRHTKVIKVMQGNDEEALWENLLKIKNNVSANERITLHDAKGIPTLTLRKKRHMP